MRFLVLRPLAVVTEAGDEVAIAESKERLILACLVVRAGRMVPVDDLVDELWGEDPPRTALKTLGSYVSRLRRVLQSDRVRARPSSSARARTATRWTATATRSTR